MALARSLGGEAVGWVALDVPTLLGERLGVGRGLLRALLRGEEAYPRVEALRRVLPTGAGGGWLAGRLGMSQAGAERLEKALGCGDFGAAWWLRAREDEPKEMIDGELGELPVAPLGERDAQRLANFWVAGLGSQGGAVWLGGVEALVLSGGAGREGFVKGLRAWLGSLEEARSVGLVVSAWREALGALRELDALWGAGRGGRAVGLLEPAEVARGLGAALGLEVGVWHEEGVWLGHGPQGAAVLAWPSGLDPAGELVAKVGACAEGVVGVPWSVLAPEWAMGGSEAGREGLSRAFPWLRWVGLSSAQQWRLARGTDEERAGVAALVKGAWGV